jgi:hypothetical protein
MDYIREKFL